MIPKEPPEESCSVYKFDLTIVQVENLRVPALSSATRHITIKVRFGQSEHMTEPVVSATAEPIISIHTHIDFRTPRKSEMLKIQVFDLQNGLNEIIGELNLEVGGRHATGDRRIRLNPAPCGDVLLQWNYMLDETAKPQLKDPIGTLTLELVCAKKLELAPFCQHAAPYLKFDLGGVKHQSKAKPKSQSWFWNESFESPVFTQGEFAIEAAVYDVPDEKDSEHRCIGVCTTKLTIKEAAIKPHTVTLAIHREGARHHLGDVVIKMKYQPVKVVEKKKEDVDEFDVTLSYTPVINGTVGLVCASLELRQYVWFQLHGNLPFKKTLQAKICHSYRKLNRVKDKSGFATNVDAPCDSIEEVIESIWKVKSRIQLLTRIRCAALRCLVSKGTCVQMTEDEVADYKIKWKEATIMGKEVYTSFKVTRLVQSIYNILSYGSEEPPLPNTTLSSVLGSTEAPGALTEFRITNRFYVKLHEIMFQSLLPGVTKKVAKAVASVEWKKEKDFLEMMDAKIAFSTWICTMASWWCETFTEYEYMEFLKEFAALLCQARVASGVPPPGIFHIQWIQVNQRKTRRRSKSPSPVRGNSRAASPVGDDVKPTRLNLDNVKSRLRASVAKASQRTELDEIKDKVSAVFDSLVMEFERNTPTLARASFAQLDQCVPVLLEYPALKLRITGHSQKRSLVKLATERASLCAEYLRSKGITANRLEVHGRKGAAKGTVIECKNLVSALKAAHDAESIARPSSAPVKAAGSAVTAIRRLSVVS